MWEINWRVKNKVPEKWLAEAVELFEKKFNKQNKQISFAVVGEKSIRRLNKQYRGKDKSTNVLAFPNGSDMLGEVILCLPVIKREAKQNQQSVKSYLQYILLHGLLHVVSFDHKTKKQTQKMEKEERALLKQL